ncbi:hypothetical protein [Nocardioides astragali]|uniref:Uncharacterized protein n=1 Tax=Nocardioides astragali TaxID=1776736 RepID=A0ABW2N5N9_9ACTN|nr:hypothetical protein [Nocardioides astragali]
MRFPCDQAYKRGTHTPNEDGEVAHATSVRHRHWESDDSDVELETKWRVSVVARGEGPWQLALRLSDVVMWVDRIDEIEDLAEGLSRGALWTLKARLQDAQEVPL